ncbi:unnamed protein product [Schistosoma margrebowiei]|uniref:Saposin B-type domain-containing protein n=1 Tax=Schistosoma margrebowiei TaxID=48269 RepID=A0AA84ZYQ7_9TREM|nr:unnamed protein product [Schistosoma margrebowiei]
MKSLCILCLLISLVFCMNNVMEDSTQQLQVQKDLRRRSQPNLYQCMACVSGVKQAKNIILSSSTKVSINGIIKNVCMGTGLFNTSCGMFANGLLSNIFYTIQKVIPYDLCAIVYETEVDVKEEECICKISANEFEVNSTFRLAIWFKFSHGNNNQTSNSSNINKYMILRFTVY